MKIIYLLLCSSLIFASCTYTPSKNDTKNTSTNTTVNTSTSTSPALRTPSPTYGSGKHELVVFADFQCPACIASSKSIMPVFENYAKNGYLHITYKQFPLTGMHKNAERDALAALCVASQWKGENTYMEYKKALYNMEDAKKWASVSDGDRVNAVGNIPSIDVSKLTECLDNNSYLDQVRAEMKEGDDLGVNGTPTLYLDNKRLDLAVFRDTTVLQTVMDRLLGVTPQVTTSTGTTATGTQK